MPLKTVKIAALQNAALIFATFVVVACGQPLESETWDTQEDIESQEHALDIDKKTKEHGCFHRDTIPMTRAQALEAGLTTIMDLEADPGEERGGIAEIES